MIIHYKSITHERTEDAPFIGALICADDCKFNCKNCFNQELRQLPTQSSSAQDIIQEVKSNPFNQGIILAGLEWSLQPEELTELVNQALQESLKVIIFTGMNESNFNQKFHSLTVLPIYIKYGKYDEEQKVSGYKSYGVTLASKNQYIKYKGEYSGT